MTNSSMTNVNLRALYRDLFYQDPVQTEIDQYYLIEVLQKVLPAHLYETILLKYGLDGKCINDDKDLARELGFRVATIKKRQSNAREILTHEEAVAILFASKSKARSEVDDLRSYALRIQADLFRRSESMMKRFSLAGTLPTNMVELHASIEDRIKDIDSRIIATANVFTEMLIHEPQKLAAMYMLIIKDCETAILDVEKVEDFAIRKTARMMARRAGFYCTTKNGFKKSARRGEDTDR